MDAEIYFKCVAACLLGNLCHIAVKYNALAIDYRKANEEYSFKHFLRDDKRALVIDLLLSFALVYVADEFVIESEWLMNKIKIVFLFIGYTGSHVILQLMSVGKEKFRGIIDAKTDKADGIVKPPAP